MATQPERRRAFRASVTISAREATLFTSQETIAVRVLNESATGFLVVADRVGELSVGNLVQMQIGDRRLEVRIARFGRDGARIRMGLEMVRELKYDERGNTFDVSGRERVIIKKGNRNWVTGASIAAVTMIVALFGFQFFGRNDTGAASGKHTTPAQISNISDSLRASLRKKPDIVTLLDSEMVSLLDLTPTQQATLTTLMTTETKEDPQVLFNRAAELLRVDQQLRLQAVLDAIASPITRLAKYAEKWPNADPAELYRRLGMGALALKRVGDTLEFSDEQRQQLSALVENALDDAEALQRQAETDRRGGSQTLQAEAKQRLELARDEAIKLLTDAQRKRLAIVGK